jgi:hypothetical protein
MTVLCIPLLDHKVSPLQQKQFSGKNVNPFPKGKGAWEPQLRIKGHPVAWDVH